MSAARELAGLASSLPGLLSEARRGAADPRPIAVSGPPSVVTQLKARLAEGGDADLVGSVGIADLERPELARAMAIVYALRGEPTPADEHALRRADHHGVPLLCLVLAGRTPARVLPYVRATDVVRAGAIDTEAVDALAVRLARRCPGDAWALAARLPVLRDAVAAELVARTGRRTALIGASPLVRGADLPLIAASQMRMLLRIDGARGASTEGLAALALLAAAGAGLALRGLARGARERLPLPAWVVNAAVAYGGTWALGRAAQRRTAETEP